MKIKKIIAGLLVATTAFSLAACGNSGSGDTKKSDADTSEKKEIVYGKSQGPYTELFEDAIVPILEKEGYTLKAVGRIIWNSNLCTIRNLIYRIIFI